MTYSPTTANRKPLFLTVVLTVLSVLCFYFAGKFSDIQWILQLLFISFATAAIQIFIRYVLTEFEYKCDNDSLYIYKITGSKKLMIAQLDLKNSASYVMTEENFRNETSDYRIKSTYNYTRNFNTKNRYVYITTIGETNFMLKIEVNEEFANFTNQNIDKSLKGPDENDEI